MHRSNQQPMNRLSSKYKLSYCDNLLVRKASSSLRSTLVAGCSKAKINQEITLSRVVNSSISLQLARHCLHYLCKPSPISLHGCLYSSHPHKRDPLGIGEGCHLYQVRRGVFEH